MIPPEERPPGYQDPATLAAVANRAAPIVGLIILTFGALESIMKTGIIGKRMQAASQAGKWPPDLKLSHKAKERFNEWISRNLADSSRQSEGDAFRADFTNAKTVRDNLAHNIEAMWIDTTGSLRILTIFDNKDYDKERTLWGLAPFAAPPPLPVGRASYGDDELAECYKKIQKCIKLVVEVQEPQLPESPRP